MSRVGCRVSDRNELPKFVDNDYSPRERRLPVQRAGKVLLQNRKVSIPVIVRNVSTEGAKLQFETFQLLPRQFELQLDDDALPVTCEKRWEDGKVCGVAFIDHKAEIKAHPGSDANANKKPGTRPVLGQIFAPVDWFDD